MSCLWTWQSVHTVDTLISTYIFKVCAWGGILAIYPLPRAVIIIDESELIQLAKTHKWAHFNWIFLTFRFSSTVWKKCYNLFDVRIVQLVCWLYEHYLNDTINSFLKFSNLKPTGYQVRVYHSTDFGLNMSSDTANYKLLRSEICIFIVMTILSCILNLAKWPYK